jgi:hypothetical protein
VSWCIRLSTLRTVPNNTCCSGPGGGNFTVTGRWKTANLLIVMRLLTKFLDGSKDLVGVALDLHLAPFAA